MRGSLVTVVGKGHYESKPRPAVWIQSNFFIDHPSVTILPITSEIHDSPIFRVMIEKWSTVGLYKPSQIMIDKITTIPKENIGEIFGHVDDTTMLLVDRYLSVFLGIAD